MMMMMHRVMCVLAVVLCCACGYTMATAAVDNDSPSGRGVSRGAVEVSCGAGGALRVRPAAESEWLTCGAGSRVSACGNYADLCRQRTARAARTTRTTITTTTTTNGGQPKAVMANDAGVKEWSDFLGTAACNSTLSGSNKTAGGVNCSDWKSRGFIEGISERSDGSNSKSEVQQQVNNLQGQKDPEEPQEVASSLHVGKQDGKQGNQPQGAAVDQVSRQEQSTAKDEGPHKALGTEPQSGGNAERAPEASSTSAQLPSSTTAPEDNSTTSTPSNNETTGTNASGADMGTTAASGSQETNSTTLPSSENTVTEAPTTTPSTAPNAEITSIASAVQSKANADSSSVSPVWMRTAAPLLIVVVLFSVTMY